MKPQTQYDFGCHVTSAALAREEMKGKHLTLI